uniref:NADH-ubiquinone oxidoreductase chain 5 n=1 Tax=Hyriopsis bialata TaxID=1903487 RepID=A0A8A3WIR4_9BIVA|nr:NADH dehydrogenase subunit 5 [Hyriopsis bialata]QTA71693.1 NADH dehydrogenase subunit 5 [Hyriopsis bialata]
MKILGFLGAPLLSSLFFFFGATLCVFSFWEIINNNSTYLIEWQIFSVCSVDWTLPIILDSMSVVFSCLVCVISGSVSLFMISYMEGEVFMRRFTFLIVGFVSSMNLLIFVPSFITILLGWDGLGIVSFALVIYYQNKKSLAAGMLTVLANRIGDALLILAICFLINLGEWRFGFGLCGDYLMVICFLVVIGAMTKSAQIPFSAWLPAAMAAPTPVSALVHSSTLVTAGVYLIIRFYSSLIESPEVLYFLSKVGGLTMMMAGLSACFEVDMKKIIALSTLSQLGLMMYTIGIGYPIIAVFHLFTHALFKALLFLCAGSVIHFSADTQDGRILGGINKLLPFSGACLILSSAVLCGMPFLSGFYSKDLILEGAFSGTGGVMEIVVVLVGASLSLVYSSRILSTVFGQSYGSSMSGFGVESGYEVISILVLALGAVFGGWVLQEVWIMASGFNLVGVFGKMVIGLVTFGGGLYIIYGVLGVKVLNKMFSGWGSWFMSSMWFMGLISGSLMAGIGLKGGATMHSHLDQGWMEIFGGQGIFEGLKNGISVSVFVQSVSLFSFIRVFMIVFIFVLIFFFLLYMTTYYLF